MQIILLHPRFMAKSITLGVRHIALLIVIMLVVVSGSTAGLLYLATQHGAGWNLPFMQNALSRMQQQDGNKTDRYVKENIAAMAIKLGEMQAEMMRLDALGERVQGLAGVQPQEFNFREKPGRGGIEYSSSRHPPHDLSMSEFQRTLDALAKDLGYRADYLNVVETTLMNEKIRIKLLPTIAPVNVSYNASGYGWRLDPITGRSAFHDGLDFAAPVGTAIIAAAGGMVTAAEYHHEFGNLLEIDHGNSIVTRYAHASKLLASVGDIVRRGQHVANIGSTGRSTGAHLHFEVLVKGVQQNPQKFLAAGASQGKLVALQEN